jgi:hypothetical protein
VAARNYSIGSNVQASKAELSAYLSKTLNYLAHIRISDTVVE